MKFSTVAATVSAALLALCGCMATQTAISDESGLFDTAELVDEIFCAADSGHEFVDYPAGVSRIETILGEPHLVLPNDSDTVKYFSYLIGKGCELEPNGAYVLVVDYPDDAARTFHITIGGCETTVGVASGDSLGDSLKNHLVDSNCESVSYPLSGRMRQLKIFFQLHDFYPELKNDGVRSRTGSDGFFVTVNQYTQAQNPASSGAAVKRIALYRIPDMKKLFPMINYPDGGLPRRYLFWREEMADGVVLPPPPGETDDHRRMGMRDPVDWYRHKVNMARFLGMNTFCRDLLEFGHNQGWDSTPHGGSAWVRQPSAEHTARWGRIVDMLSAEAPDLYVLPFYEYAGSVGASPKLSIGVQARATRPDGSHKYTDVNWLKFNADLADPDTVTDAQRILDCTITRYRDKVNFIGAWFRPRMEANPISFSDVALAKFNARFGLRCVREDFLDNPELLKKYCDWFLTVRRDWMEEMRDYLRREVNPESVLLYTADFRDPGVYLQTALGARAPVVVADNPEKWRRILSSELYRNCRERDKYRGIQVMSQLEAVNGDWHGRALNSYLAPAADDAPGTPAGASRWDLACPPTGDLVYELGTGMTYTFNRLYTVSNPAALARRRSRNPDFAAVRHYMLNEHEMGPGAQSVLGYYFSMCDRTAPYTMLAEARLLAYGDPRYIGYLTPGSMARSEPEAVRAFNLAFLALPAVPGEIVAGATDRPEIVVRRYPTGYGVYYAAINTGLETLDKVELRLPERGKLIDRVTMTEVPFQDGVCVLDFEPAWVYALKIE